jgi:transcriptional regulator with XRE-family HTH domain
LPGVAKTSADFAFIQRELGERVQSARIAGDLSQEELAGHAGVDRTTVGTIEQGKGNPTLLTIIKIAQVLGKSCADFIPEVPSLAANPESRSRK